MGGVGAAIPGETFSTSNPAVIAEFYRSGITGLLIPEYRRPQDENGSVNLRNYSVPTIRAIFPLRNRFVAAGGIKQEYDLNWRFDGEREFEGENLLEHLSNEGSLYAIYGSVGRPILRNLSVGAEFEFHRGEQERTWYLGVVTDEDEVNISSTDRVTSRFAGESVTLGALYQPFKWLDVGMSFRPGYTLSVDATVETVTGYEESRSSRIEIPHTLIFGSSVHPGDRLILGFDVEFSPWQSVDMSHDLPFVMNDYTRLSVGVEFQPSRDPLAPYWKKWPLRAGMMHRTLPSRVEGNSVGELSYFVGIGMDMGNGRGRFDIFAQYAKRGDLDTLGLEERVIRFGFSLSGFEKWIPRRKGRPI